MRLFGSKRNRPRTHESHNNRFVSDIKESPSSMCMQCCLSLCYVPRPAATRPMQLHDPAINGHDRQPSNAFGRVTAPHQASAKDYGRHAPSMRPKPQTDCEITPAVPPSRTSSTPGPNIRSSSPGGCYFCTSPGGKGSPALSCLRLSAAMSSK